MGGDGPLVAVGVGDSRQAVALELVGGFGDGGGSGADCLGVDGVAVGDVEIERHGRRRASYLCESPFSDQRQLVLPVATTIFAGQTWYGHVHGQAPALDGARLQRVVAELDQGPFGRGAGEGTGRGAFPWPEAQPDRAAKGLHPGGAVEGSEPAGTGQAPGGQPLDHPTGGRVAVGWAMQPLHGA